MKDSAWLSYEVVGFTEPARACWSAAPDGYRRVERRAVLGYGEDCWARASTLVMAWSVKTRSGFSVGAAGSAPAPVAVGVDYTVKARVGPVVISEPVRVVSVVSTEERCGFAYGTRMGHPVCGEEAFIVHRGPDGWVFLTIRSLTRASDDLPWRVLFPLLLGVQPWYRRRYLRSLQER